MDLPQELWAEVDRLEKVRLKEDVLKELVITVVKSGDDQLGPLQAKNGKWRRDWTYHYSWINWGCAYDKRQTRQTRLECQHFTAEEYTVNNNDKFFRIVNGQYTPFSLWQRFTLDVGIRPLFHYVKVDWHYEPDCLSRNSLFFFFGDDSDLYVHKDFFQHFPQRVGRLEKYTSETVGDTLCYRGVDRRIVYLLFGRDVTRRDMGGHHKT